MIVDEAEFRGHQGRLWLFVLQSRMIRAIRSTFGQSCL